MPATTTRDHDTIRRWAEARGGTPARVADTADAGGGGLLRLDFGASDAGLDPIDWDEFFAIFDDRGLTFLYQEDEGSRFNKFIADDDGDAPNR